MQKRQLGKSNLQVAPLMLGGNVFGWTADEPTSFRILDEFVDAGFNFIDTADMYSRWIPGHQGGESETVIGKWIQQSRKRERVIIATKVGMDMGSERKGLSKTHILRSAEESLSRLQTDHIDLYQSHQDDSETPFEETLEAYSQLIQDGKVRVIGASNFKADRLCNALTTSAQHNLPAYQSLQPHYNLYDRADYETNLEPLILEQGLGVIPYFSLASGFLSGKYRSQADLANRARGPMVGKYLTDRGFRILDCLDRIAQQHYATPATVSLAWLMARPGITAPIASATSVDQLKTLMSSADLILSGESITALNQASSET